jgi:COP9 signalosome complex subunit 7
MSSQAAQQFLLLAKSVRGSAATDLVTRVLEHPDIFGFDEFLRLDSLVNSLKQDNPQLLSTLTLFAYGTLSDYESERTRYILLSPLARRKLQLLTLASLAVHARILPYTLLLKQLQIESVRELEDLIIDGIYAQVIRGKLDQLNNRLNVEYAIARDVNSTAFNHMEDVLDKWCKNCSALLNVLKYEAIKANEKKKKGLEEQDKYDKEMLSMIKIIDLQGQGSGSGGGGGGRRDSNENNNNLSTLQSLSNMLTGNTDSKQGGTKKSARQTAKRFFRP